MYANSSKMLTAQQYIDYICDAQLGSCINFVLAVHLKFSTMPKTSFHCSLPSHLSISYLSLTPIHYWRRTTYICDHQSKLETKVLRLAMIKSWMDIFFFQGSKLYSYTFQTHFSEYSNILPQTFLIY